MRTIKIYLEQHEIQPQHLLALPKLITWGIDYYPEVSIYSDRPVRRPEGFDLIAHYYNPGNDSGFTMGAIWNDETKTYSYHS